MAKQPQNNDIEIDLVFPLEGIDETRSYTRQRQGTTVDAQNVRSFEPTTGRARGCQRGGLLRYFPGLAVTTQIGGVDDVNVHPIQCVTHLVSTELGAPATFGKFTYALAAGSGFGIADGASGNSLFSSLDAAAGFQFANSCWDNDGNLFVACVNQTTGAVSVYCIDVNGATTWTNTTLTCAAGANRNVPGMAVAGDFLFVGLTTTSPPSTMTSGHCRIARMSKTTGAIAAGDAAWRLSKVSFYMKFSTAAQNAFCASGNNLIYESLTTATGGILIIIDGTSPAGDTFIAYTLHAGSENNSKTRVVTDGSNIYVIASTPTAQIQKYTLAMVGVWASTAADTPNDLTFDKKTSQLIALCGSAPSLRSLNLGSGVLVSSSVASSIIWDEIDSDGQGDFVVWKNSSATNNVMGLSSTLGVTWGPSSLSNADHSGSSVNNGIGGTPPVVGARTIRPLIVAGGQCRIFSPTGSAAITGGQSFSTTAKQIFAAQNGLNMFFADGAGYFLYQASSNSIIPWVATAPGTMPMDSPAPTTAQAICTWRGRTTLYRFRQNPQLWFMSKQSDPFDFIFNPSTTTQTQATNGNVSEAGLVGDFINVMIPYSDDIMIVLCDHTIWMLKGDPMVGGRFDRVSPSIGGLPGKSWTVDPYGQLYFYAPVGGIYKMTPGAQPTPMSAQIERKLDNIDLTANIISMAWDMQLHGLAVWVTPLDSTKDGTNFFFEERTNSWQKDRYENRGHQPFAVHEFDGDTPEDRKIFVGGRDGYLRIMSNSAATDDGKVILSYVWLGPLSTKQMDDIMLKELQGTLGIDSGDMTWEVHVGRTVEEAFASKPVRSGKWSAGRNRVSFVQRSGFAIFVKLSATSPFAIERIRAKYAALGAVRRIL